MIYQQHSAAAAATMAVSLTMEMGADVPALSLSFFSSAVAEMAQASLAAMVEDVTVSGLSFYSSSAVAEQVLTQAADVTTTAAANF